MAVETEVQQGRSDRNIQYLFVAYVAIQVYLLDCLTCASDELGLVRSLGFLRTRVACFLSRICTLCYLISVVAFAVGPTSRCSTMNYVQRPLAVLSISSTASLIFYRARAVYGKSRAATLTFALMWSLLAASAALTIISPPSYKSTYSPRCNATLVHDLNVIMLATMTLYDTLITISVSYQLSGNSSIAYPNLRSRLKGSITGEGLHILSKRMLHSGQLYLAITTAISAMALAVLLSASVYSGMALAGVPARIAISSVMACYTYRVAMIEIADPTCIQSSL